jgi:hypothetical protein
MPRVGFEPTIPASERTKTFHALPVVLRKRSNASGEGGAAHAEILKWLFIRKCPRFLRSGREIEATQGRAVDEIKYFDIITRIASVRRCRCQLCSTGKAK